MYEPLLNCLDNMCLAGLSVWDRETLSKAHGHRAVLTSSDFIAAFETVRYCFS